MQIEEPALDNRLGLAGSCLRRDMANEMDKPREAGLSFELDPAKFDELIKSGSGPRGQVVFFISHSSDHNKGDYLPIWQLS